MKTITQSAAAKLLENYTDGKIFSVQFIKRTTGEVRNMTCRKGVTAHLHGGVQSFDPKAKRLVTVFDVQACGYRNINLDAIKNVKLGGEEYTVEGV